MPHHFLLAWFPKGPWIHLSPCFVGEGTGREEALGNSGLLAQQHDRTRVSARALPATGSAVSLLCDLGQVTAPL